VEKYKRSKLIPWRIYIETPSFISLVGKLSNEDVVDLACGEGFYTRMMRRMTSGKVYGFDFSENMINLAKYQQRKGSDSTAPVREEEIVYQ
jgi:ubiquinone/menaquinone biosynthesis C-methylase UbiE